MAYLFLILQVAPLLKNLKINLVTRVIAAFTVVIDIYMLNEMANSLPPVDKDPFFLVLFYSLGLISLLIAAASLSYLNRYANKKGFLLVIVSFGFILSDLFYYNGYYLDFEEFYYLDRLCNICGIGALVLYSKELIESRTEEQILL
ncbi:MAG: hypothetical protein KJO51_07435 [Gramella sp.]|nr:hypothetical protein [Christiangramia sp.]